MVDDLAPMPPALRVQRGTVFRQQTLRHTEERGSLGENRHRCASGLTAGNERSDGEAGVIVL